MQPPGDNIRLNTAMPIGEIAGEFLGGIVRVVGRFLLEVVVEFVIQGTGYMLVRTVRPGAKPDDNVCTVVGLLFWVAVGAGGYFIFRAATT